MFKYWESKEFSKNKDFSNLENKSGLYILCSKLKNGKYKAFYVGQAINLKQRLIQHLSTNEENIELKEYLKNNYYFLVYYTEETNGNNRDQIEYSLYKKLNPKFNQITPPNKKEIISINIPDNININ